MSDWLPPPPAAIPPPDRTQIERLNSVWDLTAPVAETGWRSRISSRLRGMLVRVLIRQQEFNAALERLEQSKVEAVEDNTTAESSVLAGETVSPQEVVYPGATEYVVLTNIPDASGKKLVEELYPLSRQIIRVEP